METIILSIIIFGVLVIFHEFGHFSIAKLIGVKVEEFAVGMGPKIFGIKKGETLYSLRALPLGGFCKMLGEDEESKDEKSLSNKSILGRGAVFIAGSLMNICLLYTSLPDIKWVKELKKNLKTLQKKFKNKWGNNSK